MDLRRRTTQGLAGTGAFLIVAGLSLGGAVAVAAPGPAAEDKTTESSSEKKNRSEKKSSKSKKSTTTTSADAGNPDDSTRSNDTTESTEGESTGSTGSTGSNRSTGSPSTTATTRPAAMTATTASGSGGGPSGPSDGSGPAEPASSGSGGTYDGRPITATEDDSTTTTIDDGRGSESPPSGRKPAARSGSGGGAGLPPGIYPVEPGTRTAGSPAPGGPSQTPAAPVEANPPVVVTETTAAGEATTSTTSAGAAAGTAEGVTPTDTEVRGADAVQEESPAPASRRSRQLSQTGDGTRRLLLLGGMALLAGAVVVGFTGRQCGRSGAPPPAAAGPPRTRRLGGRHPARPGQAGTGPEQARVQRRELLRRRTRSLIGVGPIENASRIFRSR
jgi:hypothetical protein